MSGTMTQADLLSPAPILEAVEQYRGTIVDLDASQVYSWDRFAQAREALVVALRCHGLGAGDRVVMALPNGSLFIAALTAILACDASPLLLHAKTPTAELHRYARRFGAQFLICEPSIDADLAEITSSSFELLFAGSVGLRWSIFDLSNATGSGPVLHGVPLHPTSGSTGLPKIALRPGFAALEEARHYTATMTIQSDDTILAIPPMSHAYGYGMCVMVPLLTSANLVCMRNFSVKLIQRALAEYPISILPTAPAMLDVLSFGQSTNFRSARLVLAAGSMLTSRSAEQFRQKTGVIPCPLYGTTETGGISVAAAASGRDVDGRVGSPMEGVQVEVRPQSNLADLGPETGKLYVRSSSMSAGYLDDQGRLTTGSIDGWFETGDLARIDADGSIHLRGRDSDVVNVSGLKVVPCEVEEVISRLPGVREVKVYGGQRRSEQIVKAAIAVDGQLSIADVRAHCEEHLVYYKRPQVVALVDALPRTPTGKIDSGQLP